MSPVHPLFKPFLAVISGKPMLPTFRFDVEVQCTFAHEGTSTFAMDDVMVEAETEEAACDLAAREILREIIARQGRRPTGVTVLRSDIMREDGHG